MANRKMAYTLGRGWAYISDQSPQKKVKTLPIFLGDMFQKYGGHFLRKTNLPVTYPNSLMVCGSTVASLLLPVEGYSIPSLGSVTMSLVSLALQRCFYSGVSVMSLWCLCRVSVESLWCLCRVSVVSLWSLCGVSVESL